MNKNILNLAITSMLTIGVSQGIAKASPQCLDKFYVAIIGL